MACTKIACSDIAVNLVSDFIFIILILLLLGMINFVLRHKRFNKARRFFGFHPHMPIKIYISGFKHPGVKTERVVNALEYETAIEMRAGLHRLRGNEILYKLLVFLGGLISQDLRFPQPTIDISPLDEVNSGTSDRCVILIGGPVANQYVRFYLKQGLPQFRFDEENEKYQECNNNEYQDIESSSDVAVIEKRIIGEQVVFLVHGSGEEQTMRAAQYLINHWKNLYEEYKEQEFGRRV